MQNKKNTTDKNEHTPKGSILRETNEFYDSDYKNENKVGYSLGFKIRNYTANEIKVLYRGGLSIGIESERNNRHYFDKTLEEHVMLDIDFKVKDVRKLKFIENKEFNSDIDTCIIKGIMEKVNQYKKECLNFEYLSDHDRCYSIRFTIRLKQLEMNLGNHSYHSELLGLIIDMSCADNDDYLFGVLCSPFIEDKEALDGIIYIDNETEEKNNASQNVFDPLNGTFQFIQLVDNRNETGALWMMSAGEPIQVEKIRNESIDSGLYIFTNKTIKNSSKYIFVPINEIHTSRVTNLGFAHSKKELEEGCHTKEFYELKKENNKLKETLKDKEEKERKLSSEYDELKKEFSEKRRTFTRERDERERKLLFDYEELKRDYNNRKRENDELKTQLRQSKEEGKWTKSVGFAVIVLKLFAEIRKFTTAT